jgi:exonuclease III
MKGLFWNSNGLRDQAKPRFLFDVTRENQLDFIAILETKRKYFIPQELGHFCANKYHWSWTQPRRRSGGNLVGINSEHFDVLDIAQGNFYLKFKLKSKSGNFDWCLISVYGAAQEEEKIDSYEN